MVTTASDHRRVLCRDLEALERELELTARAGGPSPWVERLRERVRDLRQRLEAAAAVRAGSSR